MFAMTRKERAVAEALVADPHGTFLWLCMSPRLRAALEEMCTDPLTPGGRGGGEGGRHE